MQQQGRLPVLLDEVQVGPDEGTNTGVGGTGVLQRRDQLAEQPAEPAGEQGVHQPVDAAEVVVEAAEAHPARAGDRSDRQPLLARLAVHPQGGVQELFDGGLATLLLGAHTEVLF